MQVMGQNLPPWEQPQPGEAPAVFSQDSFSMSQLDTMLQDFGVDADQMLEDTFQASSTPQVQQVQQTAAPLPFATPSVAGQMDPSPYSWPSISEPMLSMLPSESRNRLSSLLSAPDLQNLPSLTREGLNFRQSAGDVLDQPTSEFEISGSLKRKQPSFDFDKDPQPFQGGMGTASQAGVPLELGRFAHSVPNSFRLIRSEITESREPLREPPKELAPLPVHKWRPTVSQTRARPQSALLTQQPFRQGLSTGLEYETASEPHSADNVVCGPTASVIQGGAGETLTGSDVQGAGRRRKVTYRVRTNTLVVPRSQSEPSPASKRDESSGRETPSEGKETLGKRPLEGDQSADVDMGGLDRDRPSASTTSVSLGPDQVIVNATKMASFLDQLQSIQAKMQILQLQRETVKLQHASVQRAASLLEQTVSELSQVELKEDKQTQLQEKADEIRALLSSISTGQECSQGEGKSSGATGGRSSGAQASFVHRSPSPTESGGPLGTPHSSFGESPGRKAAVPSQSQGRPNVEIKKAENKP